VRCLDWTKVFLFCTHGTTTKAIFFLWYPDT
jgi:hypothetical protein